MRGKYFYYHIRILTFKKTCQIVDAIILKVYKAFNKPIPTAEKIDVSELLSSANTLTNPLSPKKNKKENRMEL